MSEDLEGHKASLNLEILVWKTLVTNITYQREISFYEYFEMICSYICSSIKKFIRAKTEILIYFKNTKYICITLYK